MPEKGLRGHGSPPNRIIHNGDKNEEDDQRDGALFGALSQGAPKGSRFPISPRGGGLSHQQLAIVSRFDVDAAWSRSWDAGEIEPPRGFCFAAMRVGGARLLVYTVHLKSNLGEPKDNLIKREEAVRQLCRHVETMRGMFKTDRVLVAGDFNTDLPGVIQQEEETLAILIRLGLFWTFQGVPRELRITFPGKGKYPPSCLDHGFVSGLGRPVASVWTGEGSDHLPLILPILVGLEK